MFCKQQNLRSKIALYQQIVISPMPKFYISLQFPATFPAEFKSHLLYSISLLRKAHGTRVIQREQKTFPRLRKFSAYSCGLNQHFNPVKRLFATSMFIFLTYYFYDVFKLSHRSFYLYSAN